MLKGFLCGRNIGLIVMEGQKCLKNFGAKASWRVATWNKIIPSNLVGYELVLTAARL